ncbi:N-acetylneuraminate synthase family protein [Halobacterium sp. BOL4-2]|uniref:N-acetylneuraminate synthase family protein n=1 Tax=Halobacterium sp. BOL4-2 TaxID=2810537 RepID=UPI00196640FB|nr:N-acetylneuraminate synthase family protein [Halobacterium sp. BOL4-2]QRY25591.1 N-acetylneuraminate synthase family protein [Halobacterium sp. BOL4-2]
MLGMNGIQIGTDEAPFVIAEVGINAGDDLELAKRFIEVAANAGADAVKFQTHLPGKEMVAEEMEKIGAGEVYEDVSGSSFSRGEHRALQSHCKRTGVEYLSTPFSVEAVDWLEELDVSAIKIGSGELTNYHLLGRAAEVGVPLLVSTGMSDYETISDTVDFLRERGAEFSLLYCVSEYPTDPEDFQIDTIREMKSRYNVPVGFSDHSKGVEASVIAMARGADFVEKHFTIDRRLPGPDQEVSIDPEQLETLGNYAELIDSTRGHEKFITEEETDVQAWARHSVVLKHDVENGQKLTENDLTTKRPGTGVSADRFYEVVGRVVNANLPSGAVLKEDDLADE